MADDIGLLQGISDGFKQGLQSYQQQKQMNFNNRVLLAEMMSKGIVQDANGNLGPSEGLLAQQKAGLLKSKHDIGQYDTDINNPVVSGAYAATNQSLAASNPGRKFDIPEGLSPADLNGENSLYGKDIAGGYGMQAGQIKAQSYNAGVGVKRDALSETVHNRALKDMQGNSQLNSLLTTKQNLENAKNNFQNGGATTQEFNELQQAVRSNAGIKGSSGVGEREETYLKSLGLNKDKVMQFLTGDPKSVLESDPAFAKQILGLVDLEIKNKQNQAGQQISKLSKGHQSFYKKPGNEGLAEDYNNVVNDQYSQFGLGQDGKPQGNGLLNQAQSQAQGQFAPDVLNYAKSHNITPEQAQVIKTQRTGGQ